MLTLRTRRSMGLDLQMQSRSLDELLQVVREICVESKVEALG